MAAGLTALRERAGLTQRELADHMGVSQPRIVAIEKSRNVTIAVLDAYVSALGGRLEVSVVREGRRTRLLGEPTTPRDDSARSASFNALNHRSRKRADSAESAEKPTGKTLLSGTRGRKPTNVISFFAKVRVAGSNPVFRSKQKSQIRHSFMGACRVFRGPALPMISVSRATVVPL